MDLEAAKTRLKQAMQGWKDRHEPTSWGKLAELVKMSPETVRLYAVGRQFPPLPSLIPLCRELGVAPISVLFGMEEDVSGFTRVGVSAVELELLKLFRQLSQAEQLDIVQYAKYRVDQSPRPDNVKSIRGLGDQPLRGNYFALSSKYFLHSNFFLVSFS
jgi:hypothetical protein